MNIQVNKRFIHYINDWDHYEYFLLGGYASSKSYNTAIKQMFPEAVANIHQISSVQIISITKIENK